MPFFYNFVANYGVHSHRTYVNKKVFCYSDVESAVNRCVEEYGIARENAEAEIRRVNRNRVHHYEYYTGMKWGEPHHYNLMLNTGTIDLRTACQLVKGVYQGLEKA